MAIIEKIFSLPCILRTSTLDSTPLGAITIIHSDQGLVRVSFGTLADMRVRYAPRFLELEQAGRMVVDHKGLQFILDQIGEYLAGMRRSFDISLEWRIFSPFQVLALTDVLQIPYGKFRTYAQVAASINHPKAIRAVGGANAANPIPLLIPCHRVVGSDLALHGYAGPHGIKTKAWLLRLEGVSLPLKKNQMEAV